MSVAHSCPLYEPRPAPALPLAGVRLSWVLPGSSAPATVIPAAAFSTGPMPPPPAPPPPRQAASGKKYTCLHVTLPLLLLLPLPSSQHAAFAPNFMLQPSAAATAAAQAAATASAARAPALTPAAAQAT